MKMKKKLPNKLIRHITPPLNAIKDMTCEYTTGLLICFLADALEKYSQDADRNMRTIEIKFNDYFSFKYSFEEDKYVS